MVNQGLNGDNPELHPAADAADGTEVLVVDAAAPVEAAVPEEPATAAEQVPAGVIVRDERWMVQLQPMAEAHTKEMHIPPPGLIRLWSEPTFVEQVCQRPAPPRMCTHSDKQIVGLSCSSVCSS